MISLNETIYLDNTSEVENLYFRGKAEFLQEINEFLKSRNINKDLQLDCVNSDILQMWLFN